MAKTWFTADTHFSHKRIPLYTKRLFCLTKEEQNNLNLTWHENKVHSNRWVPSWESIRKMNDYLINKINEFVGRDDTLWHLGDFCFAKKSDFFESAKKIRDRINCQNINLIWGNHDDKKIASLFNNCYSACEINCHNKLIVLNHYAQAIWHKSHNKSWMLYGHSHSNAEPWLDTVMPGRLSMDVGVDNIYKILGEYRPISFQEIESLFKNRTGISIDIN